jgi:hypothetical protein
MATPIETVAADGQPPSGAHRHDRWRTAEGRQQGVYWDKVMRRWYSTIQLGRKKKYLGWFHSPAEAAAAWEQAVREREAAKKRGNQGE